VNSLGSPTQTTPPCTRGARVEACPDIDDEGYGRASTNKFNLVDALVASIYEMLGQAGISSKRVNDAIGSELYGVATDLHRLLSGTDMEGLPHYLLVVEPRPPGRIWRCDLVSSAMMATGETFMNLSLLKSPLSLQ
jgi:hypothetical protein